MRRENIASDKMEMRTRTYLKDAMRSSSNLRICAKGGGDIAAGVCDSAGGAPICSAADAD